MILKMSQVYHNPILYYKNCMLEHNSLLIPLMLCRTYYNENRIYVVDYSMEERRENRKERKAQRIGVSAQRFDIKGNLDVNV